MAGQAFAYFAPTIVKTLGHSPVNTQLHTVPPSAAALALFLTMTYLSDRTGLRSPFIAFGLALTIAGLAILLNTHNSFPAQYTRICLVDGCFLRRPYHCMLTFKKIRIFPLILVPVNSPDGMLVVARDAGSFYVTKPLGRRTAFEADVMLAVARDNEGSYATEPKDKRANFEADGMLAVARDSAGSYATKENEKRGAFEADSMLAVGRDEGSSNATRGENN
ncbi:MAG: hypothetical protein Q9211_000650 [Gyalolechia sp. 1 TL-2023]